MYPDHFRRKNPGDLNPSQLSAEDYDALVDACTFLLQCKTFSFDDTKISEDSAGTALDKLIDESSSYTRDEKRAILTAIVLALRALNSESQLFDGVSPKLVSRLTSCKPRLEQLFPIYLEKVNGSGRRK